MKQLFSMLSLLALVWSFPGRGFAQSISGDLVGSVIDASGAAIPNTTIEAHNTATGVKSAATTNDSGQYRFSNLPAGTYTLTANATGFGSTALRNITVDVGKTITANFTLQLGAVSTTVEVAESPTSIDTTTATIATNYDSRQTRDLPTASVGLGVLNLSLLSAGVASNGGIGAGVGPSVGGQRPRNNNFTIDGVDNNSKNVTGPLIFVPNDAVAEFTLLQNQVPAEFGHSSGGQFNSIVKSGTNTVHGSLYDYLQNRNLNAVDQALANQGFTSNPRYDLNRLGATIGGPILKNKLFYFGNVEYNPVGASATQGAPTLTPTAAGYDALSRIPGVNQTNLGVFKQYATAAPVALADQTQFPVVNGVAVPIGILPLASPNFTNGYFAVASMDYNISEKDQLRGRYIYNKFSAIDVAANLPQFYQTLPSTFHLLSVSEYHNFSPNLTNEFRAGYSRTAFDVPAGSFKFPGLDAFPNIQIDELALNIGPDPGAPQNAVQNTYQLTDTMTWVKGKHTFRFGVDGRKYIAPSSFTQRSRGDYAYTSLENYLLDLTPDEVAQRGLGNVVFYGDQIAFYSHFNDTWRVRPNLTINLGIRHEYTTVPHSERLQTLNAISSVPGLITFGEPQPQKKNFAPRVGLAYSPGTSGNTSIRAGFGMAYDVLYDNIGSLALPPQFTTTVDVSGATLPDGSLVPNFLANGGIRPSSSAAALTAAQARARTAAYIPDQKLPYSIQWNFGIQHVFAHDYTFEARYLGTRGVHLNVQSRINKRAIVTPGHSLPTYLQAPSQSTLDSLPLTLGQLQKESNLIPSFAAAGFTNGAFVEDSPIGNSTYHGLALQLNRRFAKNLQFVTAYTWSHLIDDSTADFNTTSLTPRRPQDFQNLSAERASSALDRRHRLTISAIYDIPWFRNAGWFRKNLIGNWSVSPIYTYESPEFVTVQSVVDSNLNGDGAADRTIINLGGVTGSSSGVTALHNSQGATVGYLAKNPSAQYITAGLGAFANAGRNTLPGRPIDNVDLNLAKNFSFSERYHLQVSAQFLNALNHPQFVPGLINQVANPAVLNTTPGVRNYVTPGDPTFNRPDVVYASNARLIQVTLKLIF